LQNIQWLQIIQWKKHSRRITVRACKAINAKEFVVAARALNVTHTPRQTIDCTSTDGYN
jgi:hypothetical protein